MCQGGIDLAAIKGREFCWSQVTGTRLSDVRLKATSQPVGPSLPVENIETARRDRITRVLLKSAFQRFAVEGMAEDSLRLATDIQGHDRHGAATAE